MTVTEADFLTAIHGYISEITGMSGDIIFRGNQSRMVLPKKGPYCIYTPILRNRRGTNIYSFDAADVDDETNGADGITALILVDIQVDFYADDAMLNAQAVEVASRSYVGTDYFKGEGYDVRVVTATAPRNLTGIDTSNQYEQRWTTTITAEVNSSMTQSLPWFEDFNFDAIKNVDVYFPPTE